MTEDQLLDYTPTGMRATHLIDVAVVRASRDLGAAAIELHTGQFAHHPGEPGPIAALTAAAEEGLRLGLGVHAGHGLSVANVAPVAGIEPIEELNIGHVRSETLLSHRISLSSSVVGHRRSLLLMESHLRSLHPHLGVVPHGGV